LHCVCVKQEADRELCIPVIPCCKESATFITTHPKIDDSHVVQAVHQGAHILGKMANRKNPQSRASCPPDNSPLNPKFRRQIDALVIAPDMA
jgi:hypothetical protein